MTEPSFIYADVYDDKSQFIHRIADKQFLPNAGKHMLFWNLRMGRKLPPALQDSEVIRSLVTAPGKRIPPGNYLLKFKAEATYSSRTYFIEELEKEFSIGK